MKNYLNFELDIKDLENELEGLKDELFDPNNIAALIDKSKIESADTVNKTEELNIFYSNQINISEEIQKFISTEIKTSIRELVGAINRVVSFSRIYNKVPNLSEIKVVLKDLLNIGENKVTIDLIQSTVCRFFKISKNEMLSSRRSRYLVRPRQTAIYLTKILTSKSLPEIGREFSNRDHTTKKLR